jgi:hypothetical protein
MTNWQQEIDDMNRREREASTTDIISMLVFAVGAAAVMLMWWQP